MQLWVEKFSSNGPHSHCISSQHFKHPQYKVSRVSPPIIIISGETLWGNLQMTELYLKHTFLNFLMEKMQKYLGQIFCRNAVTQIISFITFIAILFNRPLSGHFEKHKKRRLRIIGVKLTYVLNPRKWNFNSIYIESSNKGAGNKV